jgi:hypothetical protein
VSVTQDLTDLAPQRVSFRGSVRARPPAPAWRSARWLDQKPVRPQA